jgi:signal transduction histidine kinase
VLLDEIYWANDAMIELMGYQDCPELYLGSLSSTHHLDKCLVQEMIELVLCKKHLIYCPCQVIRRDGTLLDVTYNSNAYFDSVGQFMYSRCIVQDVSDLKRLELERDVLEKERMEAQCAVEVAVRANEMKSQFLAVMTHEIRTPINGVIGTASLLQITDMTDEQRDYVDTITASADILLSLVHNILDISKIEKGKLELHMMPVNFASHIAKACSVMKMQAEERGLKFVVDICPSLNAWYICDPMRINQVMLNYLSNAIKFTHVGGVTCRVTKVESTLDTDTALIEVIDTGIGVEDPSKLFCLFVQANSEVTQKYGGTGLGLSITKKLVELMGGTVGMTSEFGKGCISYARIRLGKSSPPPPTVALQKEDRSLTSATNLLNKINLEIKQPRILIVEDNKVNQKLMKKMLETLGYTDITIAADGSLAVDAYTEAAEAGNGFTIIIMDCLMPVMDGWEATTKIR